MKDSIDLLKTEIAKEEALLDREKKSLHEMDKNAKRAEAERKRQMQKVCNELPLGGFSLNCCLKEHPVLRQLDDLPRTQDEAAEFTLLDTKDSQATLDEVRKFLFILTDNG